MKTTNIFIWYLTMYATTARIQRRKRKMTGIMEPVSFGEGMVKRDSAAAVWREDGEGELTEGRAAPKERK